MKSADRAYHMPCSTLAQVCSKPTGSRLNTIISTRPIFSDQKLKFSTPDFQAGRCVMLRRQNNMSAMPNML